MANQIQGINDGKNKKLILEITSAYGFCLIKGSIMIYATFMNKQFKSLNIPINSNELKFTSNFIWDLDNVTLKKFKMANTSIRVECFHIPTNESSPNEKLGYLILKIKEAQTIDPTSNDRIEKKSYKLIGSRNCNYNLTASLRIEDFRIKLTETSHKKLKELKLTNKNTNDDCFPKVKGNTHFKEGVEIYLPKKRNMLEGTKMEKNESQYFFTFDDEQQKLVEELEDDRMNKQITLFNKKIKRKEEPLSKEFDNKQVYGKFIEKEDTCDMSKCKKLAEAMDRMADELKEREAIVTAKELELACQKDCTDNRYISLMQNLQSSNAQTINEFSNKIFELETKLYSLEKMNMLLKHENELLKDKFRK